MVSIHTLLLDTWEQAPGEVVLLALGYGRNARSHLQRVVTRRVDPNLWQFILMVKRSFLRFWRKL